MGDYNEKGLKYTLRLDIELILNQEKIRFITDVQDTET